MRTLTLAVRRGWLRRDALLGAGVALAIVGKVVRDSGGSALALDAGLALIAVVVAWAMVRDNSGGAWLDAPRALLVAVGALSLPNVYGRLGGDGFEYYMLLRSPLLDGDLNFANDFAGLGARPFLTPDGTPTSRVLVGQAIAWAPAFLLAHLGTLGAGLLGASLPADGFSAPYGSAVTASTFLAGFGSILLIEALLRRRHGRGLALLAAAALWLATPLHFYSVANPFMSHGWSTAVATALVCLWCRARESGASSDYALVGGAAALLGIMRAQDVVLVALPLLDLALRRPPGWARKALAVVGVLAVGPAVQVVVWLRMFGPSFWSVTTHHNWIAWDQSNWFAVLFSARHGLFPWHPIFVAAALGWLALARRDRSLAALCVTGLALSAWTNGLLLDWWASDAFGARRLLCTLPLFGIGLGEALAFARRRPLVVPGAVLAALAVWNLQMEYAYNSKLVGEKDQGASLEVIAPVQVRLLQRKLAAWTGWLPLPVWVVLHDNLNGWWLDEGPMSLDGRVELGPDEDAVTRSFVGEGWFEADSEGPTGFRSTRSRRSRLRFPMRWGQPESLVVRLRANPPGLQTRLVARLNGVVLGEAEVAPTWAEATFPVSPGSGRVGFNQLDLVWSNPARSADASYSGRNTAADVDWVEFRLPPAVPAPAGGAGPPPAAR